MTDELAIQLLKAHLKQLRLPAMGLEFEKLAREASSSNQSYEQFLLKLTEIELAARAANALTARINQADFPVLKDFDTYDFSVMPQLSKPQVLDLARGEWIEQKYNCCFIGSPGTGKTHLALALGQAACRAGYRARFFTAAALVSCLEQAQKQYTLERFLKQLDRADLLICDELGYVSFSRSGVELLFRVFTDRYDLLSAHLRENIWEYSPAGVIRDQRSIGPRDSQQAEHLALHAGQFRGEQRGGFRVGRQFVLLHVVEQVEDPPCRGAAAGAALGIQRQALGPRLLPRAAHLPLQERLHDQGEEVHTQQRLNPTGLLQEHGGHHEVRLQLLETFLDQRLLFVRQEQLQRGQRLVVGDQREGPIAERFLRQPLRAKLDRDIEA